MPHYPRSHTFGSFMDYNDVNATSLPLVYDATMSGNWQPQDVYGGMQHGMMVETNCYPNDCNQDWDIDSPTVGQFSMRSSIAPNESSAPSPTSSTGSTNTAVQDDKRKQQNRAAQRAYRDRKIRHLRELQSGIEEIETKLKHLQSENKQLVRQLCDVRAANNTLRAPRHSRDQRKSPSPPADSSTLDAVDGPAEAWSRANFTGPDGVDLDALFEPFAAMWNLIHLDPSVVRGTVSAEMVLQKLKAMVEFNGTSSSAQAQSTPSPPGRPKKTAKR